MSKTGQYLQKFASENAELVTTGLDALEKLVKVVNEAQSKAMENSPMEVVGDLTTGIISDVIPTSTKIMINMTSFMTMLIVAMVLLLFTKYFIRSFFEVREVYEAEDEE